uniref:Myb/SANT-like domain-containing protein n=1 Tax=Aegilops tauschii subsp. strangulata TaxID=200361 RepID=A0A453QMZ1_AEGTS
MAEGTATGKMNYVTWDDEMDIAMLEVLVHHHNMGDHSQNGWKAHVYIVAIKNVKKKCNKDIAKDNILGRLRTFDKQFEVINKILSQSGFGWDWVNHKLSIDSDDVWTKYLEANKKEKALTSYKTKVVKH